MLNSHLNFEDWQDRLNFRPMFFHAVKAENSELIFTSPNSHWLPDRRNFAPVFFPQYSFSKKRPKLLKKYFRHSLYWKKLPYPMKMYFEILHFRWGDWLSYSIFLIFSSSSLPLFLFRVACRYRCLAQMIITLTTSYCNSE